MRRKFDSKQGLDEIWGSHNDVWWLIIFLLVINDRPYSLIENNSISVSTWRSAASSSDHSISRSLTSTDWLYIYNQQMLWPKTSQTIEKCASKRHRCRTGQSHKKATITQKFNNHSNHINVTSISLIMQPKIIGFHSKWFTFDIIV